MKYFFLIVAAFVLVPGVLSLLFTFHKSSNAHAVHARETQQIYTAENSGPKEYRMEENRRLPFLLQGKKISLMIPKNYFVADYSRDMNGVRIYDQRREYSLMVFCISIHDEPADKTMQQFKINDDSRTTSMKPWHDTGFEFDYSWQKTQFNSDAMMRVNRSFVIPTGDDLIVLDEIPSSLNDPAMSPSLEILAKSLQILN
jgi:hypothetical protein